MSHPHTLWDAVNTALNLDEPAPARIAPALSLRRRRDHQAADADPRAQLDLVREDGVLRWVYSPPRQRAYGGRRSYRSQPEPAELLQRLRFMDLGLNELTQRLQQLDQRLTPGQGLLRWQADERAGAQPGDGDFLPCPQLPALRAGDRVLLLVHGTFSQSAMWREQLQATPAGRAQLQRWGRQYAAILAFNHATLSVGAWSNALDLQRLLRALAQPLDVVCHSRGGLVLAWLLRLGSLPVERAVLIGSPLAGTSLAAPDRLRAALDLLANVAEAALLGGAAAASVWPLAAGAAGLAKIFGRSLRLGSSLPLIDAGVAAIPGLATQAAVANNLDLGQLFAEPWQQRPALYGIGGSFVPDESRAGWRFWRRFSHLGDQLKHGAADLVFQGPNDLVVDLESMRSLGGPGLTHFQSLGESAHTHHCNYLQDERVLDYLARRLAPG